jgi:uncharacterized protein YqjF (DUF2071 family)
MWKHPLPMRTTFTTCLLVNFAFPPDVLRELLPVSIEPDVRDGEAYVSVVIADMDRMRPAFLPRLFGVTYTQVVYRAVVRHRGERGVHFLRSDADSRVMCALGNWLTFFRFHHARVRWRREGEILGFDLEPTRPGPEPAGIHARYDLSGASHALRPSSAFRSLPEATAFLVELFSAFARPGDGRGTTRVRVERGTWDVLVVDDLRAEYPYMQSRRGRLDSVFLVRDVPYRWHRLEPA